MTRGPTRRWSLNYPKIFHTDLKKIKIDVKHAERNLIRAKHIGLMEFEIANKEYIKEQQEGGKLFFLKKLDYNSFLRGFVAGFKKEQREGRMMEDENN